MEMEKQRSRGLAKGLKEGGKPGCTCKQGFQMRPQQQTDI